MSAATATYQLQFAAGGVLAITCRLCGRSSAHPSDVANKYCGGCHLFHEVVAEARQLGATAHDCSEWVTGRWDCALCGRAVPGAGRDREGGRS